MGRGEFIIYCCLLIQRSSSGLRKRRLEVESAESASVKRIRSVESRDLGIVREIMRGGEVRKLIELWWPRIVRICLVCFMMKGCWRDHNISSCDVLSERLKSVGISCWVSQKILRRYEEASCCYRCSRPSDVCSAAAMGMSAGCVEEDVILPVIVMS